MERPFEHVVIAGCGLLGTSLGMALRQKGLAKTVTGVGRSGSNSVEIARQRGAIDRASDNLADAARTADLVVLCTPVRQFPEMLRLLGPVLPKGAIVTDVGSTKAQVMKWAEEILPGSVHFIGSHPMAGSEKSGPDAARIGLFDKAACLLCNPAPENEAAYRRIAALWQALGMRVVSCDVSRHDAWVAAISHLPHAVATSLALAAPPEAWPVAAGGFTDTTRVAGGDVAMWTDIFLTNRDAVVETIGVFEQKLAHLKGALQRGDETALRDFFAAAKSSRDAYLASRSK
jgi:prephenate dehydrogenase